MNIDEIVNQIAQKTGISKEQSKTAVTTTIGFIKDKLPVGIGSQLDGLIQGKDIDLKQAGDLIKNKFF